MVNPPYKHRRLLPGYLRSKGKYAKTTRGKYFQHRDNAWKRRIAWHFSFETWWGFWQESGHWLERGNKKGQFCMSRRGDKGPYSPANCYIQEIEKNSLEAFTRSKKKC